MKMRHHVGEITGAMGLHLYYQSWFPQGPIKATVALIHRLGTHSGVFNPLVSPLVAAGYGVYGLDLVAMAVPKDSGAISTNGKTWWRICSAFMP
jgi:alpha-beta hydrolase superfamily lysophospholipase